MNHYWENFWDNLFSLLWDLIKKFAAWGFYSFIGWIGFISYSRVKGKRMNRVQYWGSLGMAMVAGFLSSKVCWIIWPNPVDALKYGSLLITLSGCVAKDVFKWVFTRDYSKLLDNFVDWFKNKKE